MEKNKEKGLNLIYIDESGNTGDNLKDRQQPIFLMAAVVIHSSKWFEMEKAFFRIMQEYLPEEAIKNVELHVTDLKSRRKQFKHLTGEQSLNLRDRMLDLLMQFETPVIYRRIIKTQFETFCEENYGPGIKINPYIMALPFVCTEVDHYLRRQTPPELGMLIFDEEKQSLLETEKTLRTLRLDPQSILRTTNIIEKGFFIDSSKSFAVQLADIISHYIRKFEEHKAGLHVSKFDMDTFKRVEKIASMGIGSRTADILQFAKNHFVR